MPDNYGTVYVFNCYNEPITNLSVSGYNAGNISGWEESDKSVMYTPNEMQVPRSKHGDDLTSAAFAIGANAVIIPWVSFQANTTVNIPNPAISPVSLMDNLILYLTVNKAILMTNRGYVLETFEVTTTKMMK